MGPELRQLCLYDLPAVFSGKGWVEAHSGIHPLLSFAEMLTSTVITSISPLVFVDVQHIADIKGVRLAFVAAAEFCTLTTQRLLVNSLQVADG